MIDQFLVNLAEASVDCSIHESEFSPFVKKQIKCKMCSPNNKLLYHPILSKDLLLPNPCQELKSEEIKVKEILVNGNKYYYSYTNDTYHIFKFDTEIQGYTQLQEHDPVYADIIRILLKLT